MSELTLVALRLGFVLALWIFVIAVVLVLRNDLFERKLTDRLIEIATEGKGAVINAWEPSEDTGESAEPDTAETDDAGEAAEAEPVAKADDAGDE